MINAQLISMRSGSKRPHEGACVRVCVCACVCARFIGLLRDLGRGIILSASIFGQEIKDIVIVVALRAVHGDEKRPRAC
jgi:hypothetical protein